MLVSGPAEAALGKFIPAKGKAIVDQYIVVMRDGPSINSVNRRLVVAVAAGNHADNACNSLPARAAGVLTVGASDRTDAKASYSNYGSCVELYAPGQSSTAAWIGSPTATRTLSGTSMAAPHVAGVAALYVWGNPGAAPSTVNSWITTTATPGVISGNPPNTPNRLLAKSTL